MSSHQTVRFRSSDRTGSVKRSSGGKFSRRYGGPGSSSSGSSNSEWRKPSKGGDVWGEIATPDAAGRRIHVRGLPHNIRIQDIIDFFGKEAVQGIRLTAYFANIQFYKPSQQIEALAKDNDYIFGKKISVERYEERIIKEPRPRRSRSPEFKRRLQESKRKRELESAPRSRSSSVSSIEKSAMRDQHDKSNTTDESKFTSSNSSATTEQEMSSMNQKYFDKALKDFKSPGNIHKINKSIAENERLFPSSSNNVSTTDSLPTGIELILKLILDQKSARQLSMIQIDNLIEYLRMERNYIAEVARKSTFLSDCYQNPFTPRNATFGSIPFQNQPTQYPQRAAPAQQFQQQPAPTVPMQPPTTVPMQPSAPVPTQCPSQPQNKPTTATCPSEIEQPKSTNEQTPMDQEDGRSLKQDYSLPDDARELLARLHSRADDL